MGSSRSFDSESFWTDAVDGELFLFHLHGFSGLATYAAGARSAGGDAFWAQVVESWIASESRPRMPSWHPYPTSVRVISWAAGLSAIEGWPEGTRSRIAAELWRQARYLSRCVERDIGGNHLIKNALALAAAGSLFGDAGLRDRGIGLLRLELDRQLLADGGHEERSTSYHRLVRHDLEDAAALLARAQGAAPAWLERALERAGAWEAAMRGPDGTLALLNDSWEGPSEGAPATEPVTPLAASGYTVLRHERDQAIFDVGPLCPPHLPPHAHADALSFVLWADAEPLVIDPGSYAYTGEWRGPFRATAAHNTVELDERDQCDFWGDFRAAHLPRVEAAPPQRLGEIVVVEGRHDGYRRLAEPVDHHRALVWCPPDGLVVVDVLRGRGRHAIRSSLHLAPAARVEGIDQAGPFRVAALGEGATVTRRPGDYAPYLGTRLSTDLLEDRREIEPDVPFGWSLLREGAEVTELRDGCVVIARRDGSSASVPLELGGH